MEFLTAMHTDIGIKKNTNQDSALILEADTDFGKILLAVICDGMGGLAKGEVASSALITMLSNWFENDLPKFLCAPNLQDIIFDSWNNIIQNANVSIASYGKRNGVNMGTTIAACLFINDNYYILNVGDSRVYCLSDNVYQLTKDQTYVQREMDEGRMTQQEAETSPQRNVLLQCVGASQYVVPDFFSGKIQNGQSYIICSDGFRHIINEQEIYERLCPNACIDENIMLKNAVYLTDLNKYRREPDNISVIVIKLL